MLEERLQVGGLEPRTRRLHVGGRHAGRGHDEDAQRQPFAGIEHIADPGDTEHIRDLVRVGDGRRRSAGHNGSGELGHGHHARLDVHVRIDEARADVLALEVDRLPGLVVAEPGDAPFIDGDVGVVDLTGAHVQEARVLQQRVRGRIAARHFDKLPSQFRWDRFTHERPATVPGSR